MAKRRHNKRRKTLAEDRLSSLPDDILTQQVLCHLSTKQSIITSVLSTRWKNLFKSVPALAFDSREHLNEKFESFVNKALLVHNMPSILSFRHVNLYKVVPFSWICAAIHRNAQLIELEINRFFPWSAPLPGELFTSQMLVHLKLTGGFRLMIEGNVSLPSLKTLYLDKCRIYASSAAKLFSSCPILEDLTITLCYDEDGVIPISAPSLKSLTLHSPTFSRCKWELNYVPNLDYIDIEGAHKICSVTVLKSLHKAKICLRSWDVVYDDAISGLVDKFDEIKFLTLSGASMWSLGASRLVYLPILNKLKTLELEVSNCREWFFVQKLMEISPCLELLVIHESNFFDQSLDIRLLLPKCVPFCFSGSLKEVKVCHFQGYKVEYAWLRYILKSAKVLEKLTVTVNSRSLKKHTRKKLLALPIESKTCQIVVREE